MAAIGAFFENIAGGAAQGLARGFVRGGGEGLREAIHLVGPAIREEAPASVIQVVHSAVSLSTRFGINNLQAGISDRIVKLFLHAHKMETNDDTPLDQVSTATLKACVEKALNNHEVITRVKEPALFAIFERAISEAMIRSAHVRAVPIAGLAGYLQNPTLTVNFDNDFEEQINNACKAAMQTLEEREFEKISQTVFAASEVKIKELLRKGTEIGEEDKINFAALQMSKYNQESLVNSDITGFQFCRRNFRAIHWAAVNGNIKAIRYLSKLKEFDVNILNFYKSTAIMSVLWVMEDASQIAKVINVLLDLKADPNLPNKDGMLPLTRAIRKFKNNSGPILKVLLKRKDGRIKADAKKVVGTNKSAIALAQDLKLNQKILDLLRL